MTTDPVLDLQAGASEDEAAARNTPGDGTATWRAASQRDDEGDVAGYSVLSAPGVPVAAAAGLGPEDGAGVVTHIARQDPRDTLARVAAYRAILAEYNRGAPVHTGYRAGLLFAIEQLAGAYEDTPSEPAPEMRDA